MRYTVFTTPTVFDLLSLEVHGVSSKPNSDNPIGEFGTGLKYAISVLLREGASISLYCNGDHYEFYTKQETFRNQKMWRVWYKKTNAFLGLFSEKPLAFSTQYGKNWKLWMAFRELMSNTTDEDGDCEVTDDIKKYTDFKIPKDTTVFVVDFPAFAEIASSPRQVFLVEPEILFEYGGVQICSGKSQHLYYRNMRAYDLDEGKGSLYTYNISEHIELTEDRTFKYLFNVKSIIETAVAQCNNEELVRSIIKAPEQSFEDTLNFEYEYDASKAFKNVVGYVINNPGGRTNYSVRTYYEKHISPPKQVKQPPRDEVKELLEAIREESDEIESLANKMWEKYFDAE